MDKRKGLTASVSSQSSASAMLVASIPTMQKLIEFSVDDVFARYTVPQVQRLHKDYHQDITKAKDELHLLVGGKYRDLIRIAEEIDTMSVTAHKIDNTLADLSFQSSNYVAFGNNKFSKFDSDLRKQNVKTAREQSKRTILNNVINNELIGYDLKLQTDSLKRTQSLVHLAKIYYTIEKLFGNILLSEDHSVTSYAKLKRNFVSYLEKKLALYTFTGDAVTNNSLLGLEDVIQKTENKQWLEDESFDFLSEEFDDDDYQYADTESSRSDTLTSASSIPIVNYILAYIIVNHDGEETNSLQSITSKIINLKWAHLSSITKDALQHPNASNINFYKLFRFIESAAICINDYLVNDGEIKTRLKQLKTWNASQLIGFHHWFEEDEIHFDIQMDATGSPSYEESLQSYYDDSRNLLTSFVSSLFEANQQTETAASGTVIFSILYNLMSGASKVGGLANYEERECYISSSIFTNEFMSTSIKSAFRGFHEASQRHIHTLTEGDASILLSLKSLMAASESDGCHNDDFFSDEIISSMDEDIETYLTNILRLGSYKTVSLEQSHNGLRTWLRAMKTILLETKSSDNNVIGKMQRLVAKLGLDSSVKSQSTALSESVSKGNDTITKDLVAQFDIFVTDLTGMLKDNQGKDVIFGILSLVLELKDFIFRVFQKDTGSIVSRIDSLLADLYNKALSSALNSKMDEDSVGDHLISSIRAANVNESADLPSRADPSVHSILFGFVEELLDLDQFQQQRVISYFTNKHIKDIFAKEKTKLLLSVIDKALEYPETTKSNAETLSSESPKDNDEELEQNGSSNKSAGEKKLPSSQVQQTLANIIFVLNFTRTLTVKAGDDAIQSYLSKLNDKAELPIETSSIEIIARGVSEQFKASKDLFLPLLAT